MKRVSVIIPAYNEAKRIEKTLKNVQEYLKNQGRDFEIVVVDDGSEDGTAELIERLKLTLPELKFIRFPKNQGKGWAVRAGMIEAQGDLLLMTDADLSTPIEELEKMEQEIKQGFDIVIGSRRAPGAKIIKRQPWLREKIGVAFGFLTGLIVPTGFQDTQCGFKLFRKQVAQTLFPLQTVKGLPFDLEILILAKRLGYKIAEVPVLWRDEEGSKVRPVAHLPRVIREVFKIRWNLLRGKYFAQK